MTIGGGNTFEAKYTKRSTSIHTSTPGRPSSSSSSRVVANNHFFFALVVFWKIRDPSMFLRQT